MVLCTALELQTIDGTIFLYRKFRQLFPIQARISQDIDFAYYLILLLLML
jgi:hypothetical protein